MSNPNVNIQISKNHKVDVFKPSNDPDRGFNVADADAELQRLRKAITKSVRLRFAGTDSRASAALAANWIYKLGGCFV